MQNYDCGFTNYQEIQTFTTKRCTTCQCGNAQLDGKINQNKLSSYIEADRISPLVKSRLLPLNDPLACQVGHNAIPNRTVWFKSVSPRPSRITIKISSPDRPNLRPSQCPTFPLRRTQSYPPPEKYSTSRVNQIIQPQLSYSTPTKNFQSKYNIHQQSTLYNTDIKSFDSGYGSMLNYN